MNHSDELRCFQDIATHLAELYAPANLVPAVLPKEAPVEQEEARASRSWLIENVIFNAFKTGCFHPPRELASSGAVVQIASIDQLYKCFERC